MTTAKELDDFINGLPKVSQETTTTDAEMDALLGLKISEGPQYSGSPGEQDWPTSATGLEAAGRRATPEEERDQKKVHPAGIEPCGKG
jgi:hypothetical protein